MIAFSIEEIAFSIVSALVYGVVFALCYSAVRQLFEVASGVPSAFRESFYFDKILPPPRFEKLFEQKKTGAFFYFFSIILYAVGFCLLSYLALDGEIRLYMLILSFASFYLSNFVLSELFKRIFLVVFQGIFTALSIALRLIILPVKFIYKKLKNILLKIKRKI